MGILEFRMGYGLSEFRGSYVAAQTSTLIASSSDSKVSVVVDKLVLSEDVAGFFTLQSGANLIGPGFYGGAKGGLALDEPYVVATAGAALNFTTTMAGSHVLYVLYHLQGYGG